jgi:hypothetical protein
MIFTVGGAKWVEVGQSVVYDEDRKPSTVTKVESFVGYVWITLEIGITLVKADNDLVLVIVVADNEHFYTMYDKYIEDRHYQYEEQYELDHHHYSGSELDYYISLGEKLHE